MIFCREAQCASAERRSDMILDKYRAGINLGGWISQCKDMTPAHIAEFIGRKDIEQIAAWGLDHVRLPFDYPVLEDDDKPFVYKEEGFAVIDRLLGWCREFGLNVILDMHKAAGYSFGNYKNDNSFFTDEKLHERFVKLWQELTRRYKGEGDNVLFELLNEIVDAHGDSWNKIARKAIEGIREIDTDRYILLGGPFYNSVAGLETLEIYDDERVLYNFHFYEPMYVTHQNARWTALKDLGIFQPYPAKVAGYEKLQKLFAEGSQYPRVEENTFFDIDYLEKCLAPAIEFAKHHGKELYCGEYGALELAGLEGRINYTRDMNALFEKYKMGRALWTYKRMDFPTIDENGEPISQEFVNILRRSL
jgi:hypothetical protein